MKGKGNVGNKLPHRGSSVILSEGIRAANTFLTYWKSNHQTKTEARCFLPRQKVMDYGFSRVRAHKSGSFRLYVMVKKHNILFRYFPLKLSCPAGHPPPSWNGKFPPSHIAIKLHNHGTYRQLQLSIEILLLLKATLLKEQARPV